MKDDKVTQKKQAGSLHHNNEPSFDEVVDICEPPFNLGSCLLRNPKAAEIVQTILLHFEGDRYNLTAWCIMPNHVHTVLTPLGEHRLSSILHSWKSFSSNRINNILGRSGVLWERESFDHLIRTAAHCERFAAYTEENPVKAGLCRHPQDWPFSSCGTGFRPAPVEFIAPYQTPFAQPHSRGELPHLEKEAGSYFVTFCLADTIKPGKK